MYKNLEAEIVRHGIPKEKIAKAIGKSYVTFTLKLKGKSSFLYEEALVIQETFFPECDLKNLFRRDDKRVA
ncbi:XRE family transcriptional regulator [uncultured Phascolarctobacterium sp.]|uniref:XRE family transcriptional regulator n=1 Tax=uncultured Phascolarctobacterium sp. TaxID=512296 RepID=UPI0025FC34B2|nr:XRE family transcriptional regulator [uncultured Phascolarctobacterium sp.]